MDVDRTAPEALAFRRVYQAVVDRTPLARDLDELMPAPAIAAVGTGRGPKGWSVAAAAAVAVLLTVGAAAVLVRWSDGSPTTGETHPVTSPFVVVDDPSLLGSDARVTFRSASPVDPSSATPLVDMQVWVGEGGLADGEAIALLRGGEDENLIEIATLEGEETMVPGPGPSFTIVDAAAPGDPIGVEWVDPGDRTRYLLVTAGYDRDQTVSLAEAFAAAEANPPIPDGFALVYQGPQTLSPPPHATFRELVYTGSAGSVQVGSFDGWSGSEIGLQLRFPAADRVDVNGRPGIIVEHDHGWVVAWAATERMAVLVEGRQLGRDETLALARAVRSVNEVEWDTIEVQPDADAAG